MKRQAIKYKGSLSTEGLTAQTISKMPFNVEKYHRRKQFVSTQIQKLRNMSLNISNPGLSQKHY